MEINNNYDESIEIKEINKNENNEKEEMKKKN